MKRIILLLASLAFLCNVQAQIAKDEKGLYRNADKTLFSGTLETLEQRVISARLEVLNGELNGEADYYYASGKLMEKGFFIAGQKNGKWLRYNENDILVAQAFFNAGKKDGTWLVWNGQGIKVFEMHYTNGEKTGIWYNWDNTGALLNSKDFSNGH